MILSIVHCFLSSSNNKTPVATHKTKFIARNASNAYSASTLLKSIWPVKID